MAADEPSGNQPFIGFFRYLLNDSSHDHQKKDDTHFEATEDYRGQLQACPDETRQYPA